MDGVGKIPIEIWTFLTVPVSSIFQTLLKIWFSQTVDPEFDHSIAPSLLAQVINDKSEAWVVVLPVALFAETKSLSKAKVTKASVFWDFETRWSSADSLSRPIPAISFSKDVLSTALQITVPDVPFQSLA